VIFTKNLKILRHGDLLRSIVETWGYCDMETCGDLYLKPWDTATWRPVEIYSKNLELLRHGDLWRSIVKPGDTATWRPVVIFSKKLRILRHGDLW
jgi:hypothetical protein